jgi:hypothetical protein
MKERVQRCLDGGTTILVGSVNAQGVPACCRGLAIASDDGLSTVRVFVPLATSQDTIANIATTKRIAVSATHPPDHTSIQIKGTTRGARLADEGDRAYVERRFEQMADALDAVGLPRRVTHSVVWWPAYAIDVDVEAIYDQTPGPNAGSRLR